jgi:CD63 antigen
MGGGTKCIKYLLFVFNLLFVISGITLIVTAAVIQGLYAPYLNFLGSQFISAPILFIVVGVLIFLIAFFGCCGAVKENNCMMMTFSVFLVIIFLCELGGGIAAYILRGDLEDVITTGMKKAMTHYNQTDHGGVTETWNYVQHEGKCCGVLSYTDWFNVTEFNPEDSGSNVPDSCCIEYAEGCGMNIIPDAAVRIYQKGCLPELLEKVQHNVGIFAGVGGGIAFIQLIGIIFACLLAKSIRESYEAV